MDPHDELGVARGASADEIRRTFAAAVRRVHPDAGGGAGDVDRLRRLIDARDQLLIRLTGQGSAPADGAASMAPVGGYRNLTRLQVAARMLGRMLYVSKKPDS
jgi:hypothetical protein